MMVLDELVLTAAARGTTLELRRASRGMIVASIGQVAGVGVSPARALEALADALGTPAAVRAVLTEVRTRGERQ